MRLAKFNYYIKNGFLDSLPRFLFTYQKRAFSKETLKRINYYNKLENKYRLSVAHQLKLYKRPKRHSAYYFDMMKPLRHFCGSKRFSYEFGDVIEVPKQPSLVKSRPIGEHNQNSVLLKLNEIRHFKFINDNILFTEKKDMLVGRARIFAYQPHRISFYKKYFHHPMCDLGAINSVDMPQEWDILKMSIKDHLKYKFILSIEGNDVATNLKWIMSSNSIAVSPKLKYETWFMEGNLIPDYHYIQIKDDYSDLEEKLNYYIKYTDEALAIVKNANEYVKQFFCKKTEKKILIGVLGKYFELQEKIS